MSPTTQSPRRHEEPDTPRVDNEGDEVNQPVGPAAKQAVKSDGITDKGKDVDSEPPSSPDPPGPTAPTGPTKTVDDSLEAEKSEGISISIYGNTRDGLDDSSVIDTTNSEAAQPPTVRPAAPAEMPLEAASSSSTSPPRVPSDHTVQPSVRSSSPPAPPPKDQGYLPISNNLSIRSSSPLSQEKSSGRNSEDIAASEYTSRYDGAEGASEDSKSEIQSIMEQFEHGDNGPAEAGIISPRLEFAAPTLEPAVTHPPRRSSLQPIDKPLPTPTETPTSQQLKSPPPRTSSLYRAGTNSSFNEPNSPSAHAPQYKPTPPVPEPDPEPDLPFDFHRFLEQLRHKSADPVAKFLRSFLLEFGKKQWMVHEQVKIIADFLEFITKKMAQCDVWRTVSDAEFDNAREGMEKLVMNRLYNQTFSPAIPPPEPLHPRAKRRGDAPGPGRRGQHQEDVERDEVLAQKVRIYGWVREEHLDIKPVGEKGKKFILLAQQELIKIKSYRAPRDKVICILNCCKVLFGFLRTSQSDQSADAFVPLLIYTVLQANPEHLVSNVQYILRFRNQDKLGGEAGYYISSLMGAIQFVEGLDRTSLTVSDEEFEKNVEAAVSAIAEKHPEQQVPSPERTSSRLRAEADNATVPTRHRRMPSPHLQLPEKSTLARPEVTPRNSLDAERASPVRSSPYRNGKSEASETPEEDNVAAGLLRTIQKPLSTIGRIFSDTDTTSASSSQQSPQPPSIAQHVRRSSDFPGTAPAQGSEKEQLRRSVDDQRHRERLSAEHAAARQASAEAEEARKIQRQEHMVVVETLAGMFPALDREVIDDVVRMKEGRVGLAVDACLALSNP